MNTEKFNELLPDYVLQRLTPEQLSEFETYMEQHPEAKKQVDEWALFGQQWHAPDQVVPSGDMDANFYEMLYAETSKETKKQHAPSFWTRLFGANAGVSALRVALGAALVLIAFLLGQRWSEDSATSDPIVETTPATDEAQEIRSQLVVALSEQSSANKRLQAVSEADKMDEATDQVIAALFKMLNADPNVNVRLAAVSALSKYVENPKVREGLIMSITSQDSPLVQVALADLMVNLKEKDAINSFEKLLEKPDIDATVKQKLESSINQII